MRIIELLSNLNIPFQTEGHKHCRPGWINMPCCWCTGNPGLHLGWNIEKEYFYCWRCGYHPTIKTLSKLSGLSYSQIRELMKQFGGSPRISTVNLSRTPRAKGFKYPSGIGPLQEQHKKYLIKRNFDPEYLEKEWGLLGTGPISMLDKRDYKHRIIAPIFWDGKIITFQGRNISEKTETKYKACPKDRELIHHKHILYGKQEVWQDIGICVEGITDVWRLGVYSFAVFGINYKIEQVKEMAKRFKKIAVVFDDDPQAILQANKLIADLKIFRVSTWRVDIQGDPGSMKQDDANYLIKEIIK